MKSIWHNNFETYPPLSGFAGTDVAVIGGGIAGLLTAYFLSQRGVDTVVLEKGKICGGGTGNTTAKITSQHGVCYSKLIKNVGIENAKLYALSHQEAIAEYGKIIETENIDCEFEVLPSFLYTTADMSVIEDEADAARKLGIDSRVCANTPLPFEIKGAVKFENQAQFHPLKFINGIIKDLKIYEDTTATAIEKGVVVTNRGKVYAKKIVMATHFPFINSPGYYFARLHQSRSYVVAITGGENLSGMYYSADDGYSFRNSGSYLLIGGGAHRSGENKEGGRYKELEAAAKRFYPDCDIVAKWSAQDCIPADNIMYAGVYFPTAPDMYVATGFNKWGMTSAMVSAKLITDLICGQKNDYEKLYSPSRLNLSASYQNLIADGAQSVKGLSKEVFYIPQTKIDALPSGHGGIVEWDKHKVGVYKDEHGKTYIVSTKCTHLGCQLEWNPDEKMWECPCHGSRFDIEGNPVDNPALNPLERF